MGLSVDLRDPRVFRLFDEAGIGSYERKKGAEELDAVLASTGWDLEDVPAITRPLALAVIARAGIAECHQRGMFNKRFEVDAFLPWNRVATVVQTEPTLRVFGLELKNSTGQVLAGFSWSGGGSLEDLAERNRVYAYLARHTGS